MARLRRKKPGTAPETLEYTGEQLSSPISISLYQYDADSCEVQSLIDLSKFKNAPNKVAWLDVDGLHDVKLVAHLGELFNIHPLVLEDCVNTHQQPKVDEYDDYVFLY